jgi:hypothetical protein
MLEFTSDGFSNWATQDFRSWIYFFLKYVQLVNLAQAATAGGSWIYLFFFLCEGF